MVVPGLQAPMFGLPRRLVMVSANEDLIEELRQRRQVGDSRSTTEGQVMLRRLTADGW